MHTDLAILALLTVLFAILFFLINWAKIFNDLSVQYKKVEDLERVKKLAELNRDYYKVYEQEKEVNNIHSKALLTLSGCCLYFVAGIGHWIMEIIVVVAALKYQIGNPLFGYIVIVIAFALFVYKQTIESNRVNKKKAKAKELGNIYISKTNWVIKILGTIPDIYALYIFLMLI